MARATVTTLTLVAAVVAIVATIVVWRPWDSRPKELRDAAAQAAGLPGVVAVDMEQRDSAEPPATTFGPEPSSIDVTVRVDGALDPVDAAGVAADVHKLFVPAAESVAGDAVSVFLRVTAGEPDGDGLHPLEVRYSTASGSDDVADAFTIWHAGARSVQVADAGRPVRDTTPTGTEPDGTHHTASGLVIEVADAADAVRLAHLAAELGRPSDLRVSGAGIGYDGYGSVPDVDAVDLAVATGSLPGVEFVIFADSLEPRLTVRTAWPPESPETRELTRWLEAHTYATTAGRPVSYRLFHADNATLTEGWVSGLAPSDPDPHALPLPDGIEAWPEDPSAPNCAGTDLVLRYSGSDAATGSRHAALFARNVSDRPCAVDGLPEIVFRNTDGAAQEDILLEPYAPGAVPARLVVPPGEQALAPLQWRAMSTANDPDTTTAIEVAPVPEAEPVVLDVTEHESSPTGLDILDGARVRVGPWLQALEGWS